MKLLRFILIILILTISITFANTKIVYFYFQDQFLVIYNEENNKLFVDINSGFVIKPEQQEQKLKFVEYLLDTKTFISRDEDVFTKIYVLKKIINFDFNEVEPTNVDYYSWGPLTYKYLAIFCKKINDSITIRIPSFDQLPEEMKKDIIERYRLVFGTAFNDPQYLQYEINFKKLITNEEKINTNTTELYKTDLITTTTETQNTTNIQSTTQISTIQMPPIQTTNNNQSTFKKTMPLLFNNLVIIIVIFIALLVLSSFILLKLINKKKNIYSYQESMTHFNEVKTNQEKIAREIEILKEKTSVLENKVEQIFQRLEEISTKTEIAYKKAEEETMKQDIKDNELLETQIIDQTKALDKESLELVMFKIDNIINKLKTLEMYKEMDINIKVVKIISDLYDIKNKIRQTKTINFSQWDNLVKNSVIDLLTAIEKYQKKLGYNENIEIITKQIMEEFEIEEINIIPEQTKVNIIDHRVEGYSRNPSLPNGIITEVKEKGYKYKGVTIKRAKVMENRA